MLLKQYLKSRKKDTEYIFPGYMPRTHTGPEACGLQGPRESDLNAIAGLRFFAEGSPDQETIRTPLIPKETLETTAPGIMSIIRDILQESTRNGSGGNQRSSNWVISVRGIRGSELILTHTRSSAGGYMESLTVALLLQLKKQTPSRSPLTSAKCTGR